MLFFVRGLAFTGGEFIGTAGPVSAVAGTLVFFTDTGCFLVDSPSVPLSESGEANFRGMVSIPEEARQAYNNDGRAAFLIRIQEPNPVAGAWIADGILGRAIPDVP